MSPIFRLALMLLGSYAASLDAQMITVKDYRETKDMLDKGKNDPTHPQAVALFDTYIKGIGDGFVWANIQLQTTGRERIYCTPQKLGMNSQNYQQILESYLPTLARTVHWPSGNWKSADDVPVSFVLLEALIDAFPCGARGKQ